MFRSSGKIALRDCFAAQLCLLWRTGTPPKSCLFIACGVPAHASLFKGFALFVRNRVNLATQCTARQRAAITHARTRRGVSLKVLLAGKVFELRTDRSRGGALGDARDGAVHERQAPERAWRTRGFQIHGA